MKTLPSHSGQAKSQQEGSDCDSSSLLGRLLTADLCLQNSAAVAAYSGLRHSRGAAMTYAGGRRGWHFKSVLLLSLLVAGGQIKGTLALKVARHSRLRSSTLWRYKGAIYPHTFSSSHFKLCCHSQRHTCACCSISGNLQGSHLPLSLQGVHKHTAYCPKQLCRNHCFKAEDT